MLTRALRFFAGRVGEELTASVLTVLRETASRFLALRRFADGGIMCTAGERIRRVFDRCLQDHISSEKVTEDVAKLTVPINQGCVDAD